MKCHLCGKEESIKNMKVKHGEFVCFTCGDLVTYWAKPEFARAIE